MIDYHKILRSLPELMSGDKLTRRLAILPEYDSAVRTESQTQRLMALQDLYRVYIPSAMSAEIYHKLYLAMVRSLQKKSSKLAVRQGYENHRAFLCQDYTSIMGGADSFTIIGISGIGKSSAISRAITLMTENRIIELEKPYLKILPCLVVQCPFDSSVKGMLLEILRKVDEALGSNYYTNAIRSRATTDMLIGSVSQVCLNHIGLLVCDEIQHVVNSKNGKSLVGGLTQLINNSGISICMVGTPEAVPFFEQAMQLARRSVGLQYGPMEYGGAFLEACSVLFSYQYVKNQTELTADLASWLFEHSGGVVSVVVSLIHDAQEMAILSGRETLDRPALEEAYRKRLALLHSYIQPAVTHKPQTGRRKKVKDSIQSIAPATGEEAGHGVSVSSLAGKAKSEGMDIVSLLKKYFTVEEVAV